MVFPFSVLNSVLLKHATALFLMKSEGIKSIDFLCKYKKEVIEQVLTKLRRKP